MTRQKAYNSHKSTRYHNKDKSISPKPLPKRYEHKENCCGCSAYYAICPAQAITMEHDEEGFLYPIVDAEKCVRCYHCFSVCAFKVDQRAKGYLGGESNG